MPNPSRREKRPRPRPARVRFFELYRAPRVRSASGPRPLPFSPGVCCRSVIFGGSAISRWQLSILWICVVKRETVAFQRSKSNVHATA
eukprot:gene16820-biopygen14358